MVRLADLQDLPLCVHHGEIDDVVAAQAVWPCQQAPCSA